MNIIRRQTIYDYIQTKGKATYNDLMELCPGVSSMTLRRDIEHLEKEGLIIRVRGGARSISGLSNENEDKYAIRAAANVAEKTDIVTKALPYIETEHAVYFDSGSTTMLLASKLENGYYSIITSAPNLAIELMKKSKVDVTLLGGRLDRDTLAVAGISAIHQIEDINIDTAILATSGFSINYGFTSSEYNEAMLKKAVIKKAQKVVMLMDSSKFDKNLSYTFATLKDINMLIVDKRPSQEMIALCEENDVQILF